MDRLIVLILIVAALDLVAAWVTSLSRLREAFRPFPMTKPLPPARRAEAAVLALTGASVYALCLVNPHTGGFLLQPSQLAAEYARIYWVAAVVAGVFGIGAVWVAARGMTRLGVWMMSGVLIGYGAFLNTDASRFYKESKSSVAEDTPYVIGLADEQAFSAEIIGADLWVNGVYLGKTPIHTTIREFRAKVPVWDEPPDEYNDHESHRRIPDPAPDGWGTRLVNPWLAFQAPLKPDSSDPWIKCYARAGLAGPGYSGGGSSGSGGAGGYSTRIDAIFPEAHARLERLLDQARANEYRFTAAWVDAAESHGPSAIALLRHLKDEEPALESAFTTLLARRLPKGLDQPASPTGDEALRLLRQVMAAADRQGQYSTRSAEGELVARLIPQLDPVVVAELAVDYIHEYSSHYVQWTVRGDALVEFSHQAQPCRNLLDKVSHLPPSGYVLAHAAWLLDQRADAQTDRPNPIERIVVPALLRWHYQDPMAFRAASAIEGPEFVRFVERQDWRREFELGDAGWVDQTLHIAAGNRVNKWLWALAHLQDKMGRLFRRHEQARLLQLAQELMSDGWTFAKGSLDFLFMPATGGKPLAADYWPSFKEQFRDHRAYDAPQAWFWYLTRLDPYIAIETYVQAWRDLFHLRERAPTGMGLQTAFDELKRLPEEREIEILKAIQSVTAELSQREIQERYLEEVMKIHVPAAIQLRLVKLGDEDALDQWLNPGNKPTAQQRLELLEQWLTVGQSGQPLLNFLAAHSKADWRVVTARAIPSHPTPENWRLLVALLEDPSPNVREAARAAREKIEELMATPPAQFRRVL